MTECAMMSMGLFVILVWPMFIEGTFTWYVVSDKGISKHSAWSRKLFLRWDEIESIEFTAINDWFAIKGSRGTVRLHSYLVGLPQYAKSVIEHVPEERWSSVKEHVEQLASMCDKEDVNSSKGVNCH